VFVHGILNCIYFRNNLGSVAQPRYARHLILGSEDLKTSDLHCHVHLHRGACAVLFLDLTNPVRGHGLVKRWPGAASVAARDSSSSESERESEFWQNSENATRYNGPGKLSLWPWQTYATQTHAFFKLIGCCPAPCRISTENKLAVRTSRSRISDCVL